MRFWGCLEIYLLEERTQEKVFAQLGQDRERETDSEQRQDKNVVIVFCIKTPPFPLFQRKTERPTQKRATQTLILIIAAKWTNSLLTYVHPQFDCVLTYLRNCNKSKRIKNAETDIYKKAVQLSFGGPSENAETNVNGSLFALTQSSMLDKYLGHL